MTSESWKDPSAQTQLCESSLSLQQWVPGNIWLFHIPFLSLAKLSLSAQNLTLACGCASEHGLNTSSGFRWQHISFLHALNVIGQTPDL